MSFSDVLTIIGVVAGIGLMLVMAVVPLLTDRHRPHSDRPRRAGASTTVTIPAQRGSQGRTVVSTRAAGLRAAPR
ncbi:hypothetical protein ACQPZA_27565 [Pseudonocardia xinjiangensis]|jgi:hypothetical protein|uniref:hypothetical protein n=1 Tax=Pseudonocardia xinjiangensis TaxID=75289 RepID=UPI003D8CBF8F